MTFFFFTCIGSTFKHLILRLYLMLVVSKHTAFKLTYTNLLKHAQTSTAAQNASLEIHCSICKTLHLFDTCDELFCSYTPYLLQKALSWAAEKAVSTASWLFQVYQGQPLGGMGDITSLRADEHVQLQSFGEKAVYPLTPAPHTVPAQHAKSRKVCLKCTMN